MQLTTQAAAELAHLLALTEDAMVEAVKFINAEYASETASALDGDPIERGECRVVRDRLCALL